MIKIWFEKSYSYFTEKDIKFSLGWFWHSPNHPYVGLTINFTVFDHLFMVNYVNNFKLYTETMKKRRLRPRKQ